MTPNEYQKAAIRTEAPASVVIERRNILDETTTVCKDTSDHLATRLEHALIGLASEVGELMTAYKAWIFYGKPLDEVNVVEELGDCLWYLSLACSVLNVDLEDVMKGNIAKLRKRYPEKFTEEAALNRDLEGENLVISDSINYFTIEPLGICAVDGCNNKAYYLFNSILLCKECLETLDTNTLRGMRSKRVLDERERHDIDNSQAAASNTNHWRDHIRTNTPPKVQSKEELESKIGEPKPMEMPSLWHVLNNDAERTCIYCNQSSKDKPRNEPCPKRMEHYKEQIESGDKGL